MKPMYYQEYVDHFTNLKGPERKTPQQAAMQWAEDLKNSNVTKRKKTVVVDGEKRIVDQVSGRGTGRSGMKTHARAAAPLACASQPHPFMPNAPCTCRAPLPRRQPQGRSQCLQQH
eukprot:15439642-Alexandrium_andersonii.AAC.1